jgi:hypothetical protein
VHETIAVKFVVMDSIGIELVAGPRKIVSLLSSRKRIRLKSWLGTDSRVRYILSSEVLKQVG